MVLKGVNWVHNDKLYHMVLKGVIWVHNYKIRSNGLERSQWGTYYKIGSKGLERSQLGTQYKTKILSYGIESSQFGYTMLNVIYERLRVYGLSENRYKMPVIYVNRVTKPELKTLKNY